MYSSVTGSVLKKHHLTPGYWAQNMTSAVRFAAAMEQCLKMEPEVNSIIEIGPHPALKSPIQEILRSEGRSCPHFFGTCRRGINDFESILGSTGEMIAAGLPFDLRAPNGTYTNHDGKWMSESATVLTDLPSYQWNHTASFWSESRVSQNMRHRAFPRHELLGSRYVDDIPSRACWRNYLNPCSIPWLAEPRVSLLSQYLNAND